MQTPTHRQLYIEVFTCESGPTPNLFVYLQTRNNYMSCLTEAWVREKVLVRR